jgi:hypothetical protein
MTTKKKTTTEKKTKAPAWAADAIKHGREWDRITYNGKQLYNVGFRKDGTLCYPSWKCDEAEALAALRLHEERYQALPPDTPPADWTAEAIKRGRRYRWAYHPDGRQLYNVGFDRDGTLYNPNGYEEAEVLAALRPVEEERQMEDRERRRQAQVKAVITRMDRREKLVYEVAQKIIANHAYGPLDICCICKKELSDPESIERGIGSDCWQDVMAIITRRRAEESVNAD